MEKFIFGNWKMNGTRGTAEELAREAAKIPIPAEVHVAIFPPFLVIPCVAEALEQPSIKLGAQDCSVEAEKGAYTGDISAVMLREAGCTYVIVGHSERRQHYHESDEIVKNKAEAALKAGLIPVICVGETEQQRKQGTHKKDVEVQVKASMPSLTHTKNFIIAYEPVWAIGSGTTPTLEQIDEMHKTIASLLTYDTSGARTAIIYGGSVKPANAKEILALDTVDGALVGGASLKPDEFAAIIAAAGKR